MNDDRARSYSLIENAAACWNRYYLLLASATARSPAKLLLSSLRWNRAITRTISNSWRNYCVAGDNWEIGVSAVCSNPLQLSDTCRNNKRRRLSKFIDTRAERAIADMPLRNQCLHTRAGKICSSCASFRVCTTRCECWDTDEDCRYMTT